MEQRKPADLARAFYTALAAGDRHQLDALLHPEFTGRTAEGMPFGIGGDHSGPAAMRRNAWGAIARHFEARAEPDRFLDLADGRLLVTGRYRGRGKQSGATLDAAFAHLITVDQGRIRTLEQYTDTARWHDAADIVVAADDARFAVGYGALGLTADGGNTWFLPRMVGMRQAQELLLLNRRLTAQEALKFGLVSRLAPSDAVESEAAALAATLAAGPTRAYGAVRRMLHP